MTSSEFVQCQRSILRLIGVGSAMILENDLRNSKRERIMNWKRNTLIAAIGAAITLGTMVSASAETNLQHHHPRCTEVNHRG